MSTLPIITAHIVSGIDDAGYRPLGRVVRRRGVDVRADLSLVVGEFYVLLNTTGPAVIPHNNREQGGVDNTMLYNSYIYTSPQFAKL